MTREVQENYLSRISDVSNDISELRRVQMEIATSGSASATLSSGGGTKSFTRLDLNTLTSLIRQKERELVQLRSRLNGTDGCIRRVYFTRG